MKKLYTLLLFMLFINTINAQQIDQSTTSCTPPATPTGFTATAISSSEIKLSWNTVSGAIGYDISYCDGTYIGFTSNNTFSHTGRAASTTYSYKISAQKNATCVSPLTSCASAKTLVSCTPPSTPTGFNASAVSTSQINLSWNAVAGAIGYDISYCDGTYIGFTSNTTFSHTGRAASTTYSYKISAQKSASCVSPISSCVNATTLSSCVPPSTPTAFNASAVSTSQINLSWNAVAGAIGYDIYYCDGTYIGFTSNTSYSHTGRAESTTYSYKVRAQKSASCVSPTSSCVNATTLTSCTPPSTPTGFYATASSASQINLSWNAVSGATGYDIYYCDGTYIGFTNSTSYSHTGRASSTTYSYKIRTQKNSTCFSSLTGCVNATTLSSCVPPSAPTGLKATAVSSSQINLSWDAVAGAIGYDISYCDGTFIAFTSNTTYSHTGRSASTNYAYKISAQKSASCVSPLTSCVNTTTFSSIPPSVNITGSTQIPSWQREGDVFNGSMTVDLSNAQGNTWFLEIDIYQPNTATPANFVFYTPTTLNKIDFWSTDPQVANLINTGVIKAGCKLTYSAVLGNISNHLDTKNASVATKITEEKWVNKNVWYYNYPGRAIKLPIKYVEGTEKIRVTFMIDRNTAKCLSCISNYKWLKLNQSSSNSQYSITVNNINTNFFAELPVNNNPTNSDYKVTLDLKNTTSNINTSEAQPGEYFYAIDYLKNNGLLPIEHEEGKFDLTKFGSLGDTIKNDTTVILIGGNRNMVEENFQYLNSNSDPSHDFSIANNFRYGKVGEINANYNTWYIAQGNTNFIENNAYNIGVALDSIVNLTNPKEIHLVAHSFGGVQVKTMLAGLGKSMDNSKFYSNSTVTNKIKTVTFLGTPHNGVTIGSWSVFDGNAANEMIFGSQFLNTLSNVDLPNELRFLNITGNDPTNSLTDFEGQPSDCVVPVWSSEKPLLKKGANSYFRYPSLVQLYIYYDGDYLPTSPLPTHSALHHTNIASNILYSVPNDYSTLNRIFAFIRNRIGGSVPLNLLYFNALQNNSDVLLLWKTTQEQNMSKYEIERSKDGRIFTAIGSLSSLNNTLETNYQFTDSSIFVSDQNEGYYYRLKQIERDGNYKYSSVVYVKRIDKDNFVQVVNTVFNNTLNIRATLQHSEKVSFILSDFLGQKLYSKEMIIQKGNSVLPLTNLPVLNKGYYILQIVRAQKISAYKVYRD